MKKRWMAVCGIASLLAVVLLRGALALASSAHPPALEEQGGQFPSYRSSIQVNDAQSQYGGMSEADQSVVPNRLAPLGHRIYLPIASRCDIVRFAVIGDYGDHGQAEQDVANLVKS